MHSLQSLLCDLLRIAVDAAHPGAALSAHLSEHLSTYPPAPSGGRTVVLGLGKAAAAMGLAVEAAWPTDAPLSGVLVGPGAAPGCRRLRWVQGEHPVPGCASLAGAAALLDATRGLTTKDHVIALVSGGASALACAPVAGLSLADKQGLTRDLLACGAPIHEINVVRKHLSQLKGGRLAAACAPARVFSFVISDVPGDQLDLVGSGPTLADPSTCSDALTILERYALVLPPAVREALEDGRLETPKPGDRCFSGHVSRLVASPQQALQAARRYAEAVGWRTYLLSDALEGEARDVGAALAQVALGAGGAGSPFVPPCLLLSGGETTVTLRHPNPGVGGRNAETLLACLLALQGQPGAERISVLMADTDGIDGAGPGAGAWFLHGQGGTPAALRAALDRHDAGGHFARLGQALLTGPTGTNVNDFRAIVIEAPG